MMTNKQQETYTQNMILSEKIELELLGSLKKELEYLNSIPNPTKPVLSRMERVKELIKIMI